MNDGYLFHLIAAFKGGRELGVEPILTPKQMAEAVEEHLGTMAYAAWFQSVSPLPIRKGGEKIKVTGEGLHTAYVNKPVRLAGMLSFTSSFTCWMQVWLWLELKKKISFFIWNCHRLGNGRFYWVSTTRILRDLIILRHIPSQYFITLLILDFGGLFCRLGSLSNPIPGRCWSVHNPGGTARTKRRDTG